jgi:hypothetical protein
MWEEIEAVFDKIEKWHREFQLRFSQPFFYSLTKKLPQISRSSRNHCTCRHSPRTTHRRSSKNCCQSVAVLETTALAANQPHTVAPPIPLHRWILHRITIISSSQFHIFLCGSTIAKRRRCAFFIWHGKKKKKMMTILDAAFTISDTAPVLAHEPCGQGSSSREGE